jgi:RNA polymerase sigma factor for flagellar operon FliA
MVIPNASVPKADMSKCERLVSQHFSLVRKIAVRIHKGLPDHVDVVEDLVQAGFIGLVEAAQKYDPDKRVDFRIYANHRIRGAILDALRDMDWATRTFRKRKRQLESITWELTGAMGRNPTEAEIADKMGMDIASWRRAAAELHSMGLISASAYPNTDSDVAPEFPDNRQLSPDAITEKLELRTALSSAIKTLPQRYQAVIALYYIKDQTMLQIGRELGIHESRVCQIHKAALVKMSDHLKATGIYSSGCMM